MLSLVVRHCTHGNPEVGLHHRPGPNTTNNTPGNGRNGCAEFTHDTHKSRVTISPAQTRQNKQHTRQWPQRLCGIRNLPTHDTHKPQVARRALDHWPNTTQTKSRQWPQRLCGIYPRTHVALHGRPKKSGNGRIDYAEFSHGGHQIPASKNVLKTSFSKGELGTGRFPWKTCMIVLKLSYGE